MASAILTAALAALTTAKASSSVKPKTKAPEPKTKAPEPKTKAPEPKTKRAHSGDDANSATKKAKTADSEVPRKSEYAVPGIFACHFNPEYTVPRKGEKQPPIFAFQCFN